MAVSLFNSFPQEPLLKADASLLVTLEIPKEVHEEPVSRYRGISSDERNSLYNSDTYQAEEISKSLYTVGKDVNIILPATALVKAVSVFAYQAPIALATPHITQDKQSATEESVVLAIRALQNLMLGSSVEKLKSAGDKVLSLDASQKNKVNTVYQKHFDYHRTAGFRILQYSPYAELGYDNLRLAHLIAKDLLELDKVSAGEGLSKADELMEFSLEFPDSLASYISGEVPVNLDADVRAHLDRYDLGKNPERDKQLMGMAFHLPFDSTLLLRVVVNLKDEYPELVRDLVNYQKGFFDFTSPLYGPVNSVEEAAVDRLIHI